MLATDGQTDQANASGEAKDSTSAETARRLRKREQDRRCQRKAREKTKNRIAYLEGLVEDLKRHDASGEAANLLTQLSETRRERDMLANTLKNIEGALKNHGGLMATRIREPSRKPSFEAAVSPEAVRSNFDSFSAGDALLDQDQSIMDHVDTVFPDTNSSPEMVDASDQLLPFPAEEHFVEQQVVPCRGPDQDPIVPRHKDACDCSPPTLSRSRGQRFNFWRYANEVLTEPKQRSAEMEVIEDALENDIPIRAMLEGWDVAEQHAGGSLPPSWDKLRRIDEIIFSSCQKTERLAILYLMHGLLRYHASPTKQHRAKLPPWYLKRYTHCSSCASLIPPN